MMLIVGIQSNSGVSGHVLTHVDRLDEGVDCRRRTLHCDIQQSKDVPAHSRWACIWNDIKICRNTLAIINDVGTENAVQVPYY